MESIEKIINEESIVNLFGNEYEILDFVFSSSGFLIFLIKTQKISLCYLEKELIQKVAIDFSTILSGSFAPDRITMDVNNNIYLFMIERESEKIPSCIKIKLNGKIESYYFFKNHITKMLVDSEGNIFVSYSKIDEFMREDKLFEKYDPSGELKTSRFPTEDIEMTIIKDFCINKKDFIFLIGLNQKFCSLHVCYFVKMSNYLDIIDIYVDMETSSKLNIANISLDSQDNIFILLKNSKTIKIFDIEKNFQDFKLDDFVLNIDKIVIFNDELYIKTRREITKIKGPLK